MQPGYILCNLKFDGSLVPRLSLSRTRKYLMTFAPAESLVYTRNHVNRSKTWKLTAWVAIPHNRLSRANKCYQLTKKEAIDRLYRQVTPLFARSNRVSITKYSFNASKLTRTSPGPLLSYAQTAACMLYIYKNRLNSHACSSPCGRGLAVALWQYQE